MLAQMGDTMTSTPPEATEASAAVARMREMSADLRGCAILAADGKVLASSGDPERWAQAGAELLDAADSARGEPAARVHVATADGEAFAVRESELAMVTVADRFALASLMLFDMRVVLRDLAKALESGGGS